MDTGCSDAESSSSHGVSWSNLTNPCCVQGSRQRHYSRSHDLQNENVLLLVIFQTYGVSSRHDGHSYVCSMGLWFLLHTVCCNCCPLNKRMNGHRDDWRHRRFERSPTAEHFHSADHDFLSNASVCCLEHNKDWSDSTRKLRESYWIRRLNTLCPFGINKGD